MSVLAKQSAPDRSNTILAIEDNPGDRRLLEEAVRESGIEIGLHTVTTAEDAVAYLRTRYADTSSPLPDLVLTDLHLPGKDGQAVVRTIREELGLDALPVVVLTRSDGSADVQRCYEAGANAFLTKPTGFDELIALVETVEALWINPTADASGAGAADLEEVVAAFGAADTLSETAIKTPADLPGDDRGPGVRL